MNLWCVPPHDAAQYWPLARYFIAKAINKVGISDPVRVEFDVVTGAALLWIAAEDNKVYGAGVTQFADDKRVCEIVAWGADDHDRCDHLLAETIEPFARAEGCTAMRFLGRQGWTRKLPDWRLKAVVLEKAL